MVVRVGVLENWRLVWLPISVGGGKWSAVSWRFQEPVGGFFGSVVIMIYRAVPIDM